MQGFVREKSPEGTTLERLEGGIITSYWYLTPKRALDSKCWDSVLQGFFFWVSIGVDWVLVIRA